MPERQISSLELIGSIVAISVWLWMFMTMLRNSAITGKRRFYWIIGFLLFGLIGACYYFVTVHNKD